MKPLIIILSLTISGCAIKRQHQREHIALDSVRKLNAAGAVTDSIYSKK